MPAFMAFAASSTSGTNRIPSRKSMPTMRIPSTSASLSTRSAPQPRSSRMFVPLDDLVGEAVVEVVVHLGDELVVAERCQIEYLVGHRCRSRVFRIVERYCIVVRSVDERGRWGNGAVDRPGVRDPRRGGGAAGGRDGDREARRAAEEHGGPVARRARAARRGRAPGRRALSDRPGVAALAAEASAERSVAVAVRPELANLVRMVGESAGLAFPDGYEVRYVDQVESDNAIQVRDWTGTRAPLHAAPSGLVLLAHWPQDAIAAYVAHGLERLTSKTMVEPGDLAQRLEHVRREGIAWGLEEFAEGINSIAAPVRDGDGKPIAAIHCHGPAYRFPAPGREALGRGAGRQGGRGRERPARDRLARGTCLPCGVSPVKARRHPVVCCGRYEQGWCFPRFSETPRIATTATAQTETALQQALAVPGQLLRGDAPMTVKSSAGLAVLQ